MYKLKAKIYDEYSTVVERKTWQSFYNFLWLVYRDATHWIFEDETLLFAINEKGDIEVIE